MWTVSCTKHQGVCSLFWRHLVMSCNENMTPNDRYPCTFNLRHFPVLHFPALHFCPSFSCPVFSSPSLLSVIFQSYIFHPRYFIARRFPVLHFQRPSPSKRYKIELYLQWRTNRKSYMVYRKAPFSITLNNSWPSLQGHVILWRLISRKWFKIRP